MILFDDLKKVGSSRLAKSVCLMALCLACLGQVTAQNVAKIGDTHYTTLDAAIDAVQAGETIEILADSVGITNTKVIPANVTITGQGKTATKMTIISSSGSGITINNPGVTLKKMTIDGSQITSGDYKTLVNVRADNVLIDSVIMTKGGMSTWNSSILVETLSSSQTFTVSNSTISGSYRGVLRESCSANIVITNCDITAIYPFNIDGGNGGTVTVTGGSLRGWTSYGGLDKVSFTDVEFSKGAGYAVLRPYVNTEINGSSFSSEFKVDPIIAPSILFNNCDLAGTPLTSENIDNLLKDQATNQAVSQEDPRSHAVVVNGGYSTNDNDEITGGIYGGNPEVLSTMIASGYAAFPLNTDPQTYQVDPAYFIHFNANGGSGTMEDSYVLREAPNNVFTVPACGFTHADFTFSQWNTKADGTGTNLAVGAEMTLTRDTTLYAQWQGAAKIGNTQYATLDAAIDAVQAGQTIEIIADSVGITNTKVIPANVTITGQGKTATKMTIISSSGSGITINNPGVTLKKMTIDGSQITSGGYKTLVNVRADDVLIDSVIMTKGGMSTWNSSIEVETLSSSQTFTVSNSTISGSFRGVLRESCNANIVITNCDITAIYPFNIDGGNGGTVTVTGGSLRGWTSYSGLDKVSFTDVEFSKGAGYAVLKPYVNTEIIGSSFSSDFKVHPTLAPSILFNDCELAGTALTSANIDNLLQDVEAAVAVSQEDPGSHAVVVNSGYSTNDNDEITGGIYGGNPEVLSTMIASGYAAFPLNTDPQTYQVDPAYFIHFNAAGGTGTHGDSIVRRTSPTFTVPANTEFTYGSYGFLNWNSKPYGAGTGIAVGSTMTLSSDTTLYAEWNIDFVAKIGSTTYTTFQAAIDDATANMTGDVTIELMKNITEWVLIVQKAGLNLTIDGHGTTLTGQIIIDGEARHCGSETLAITNLNFAYADGAFATYTSSTTLTNGFVVTPTNKGPVDAPYKTSRNYIYSHNITVKDCNFDGNGSTMDLYAFKGAWGSNPRNIKLENCTAKNVFGFAFFAGVSHCDAVGTTGIEITDCEATENIQQSIYISGGGSSTHNITGNTFTAEDFAVYIDNAVNSPTYNFSGNTLSADTVFKLKLNDNGAGEPITSNTNINITGGAYIGLIKDYDPTTHLNISGGAYSQDVSGEPCAEGYASFWYEDPGYWIVMPAYFLTYDANGGDGTMDDLYWPQDSCPRMVTVAANSYTYDTYAFAEWNTKADGTGTRVAPGAQFTLTQDTVLYAQWARVKNVTQDKYYNTLQAAINDATAGDSIVVLTDLTTNDVVLVGKNLTINGCGHILTTYASRGIRVTTNNKNVKVKNLTLDFKWEGNPGSQDYIRGFQIDGNISGVNFVIDSCRIIGHVITYNSTNYPIPTYGMLILPGASNNMVTVSNSYVWGRAALNCRGNNSKFIFENDTLYGVNTQHGNTEAFGTIVLDGGSLGNFTPVSSDTISLVNSVVIADKRTGADDEMWMYMPYGAYDCAVYADANTKFLNKGDNNTAFSDVYIEVKKRNDPYYGTGNSISMYNLTDEEIQDLRNHRHTVVGPDENGFYRISHDVIHYDYDNPSIVANDKYSHSDLYYPTIGVNDKITLTEDITLTRNIPLDFNGKFTLLFDHRSATHQIVKNGYSFVLGEKAQVGTEIIVDSLFTSEVGEVTRTGSAGDYTYSVVPYIAKNMNTGTSYISLQTAVDDVNAGDTVRLLSNIACTYYNNMPETGIIIDNKNLTIDLNSHYISLDPTNFYDLTIEDAALHVVSGNLTIKDSQGGGYVKASKGHAVLLGTSTTEPSNVVFTLNGGELRGPTTQNVGYGLYVNTNDSVVINGGKIENQGSAYISLYNNNGTTNIHGGTIGHATNFYGRSICVRGGVVNIDGGSVISKSSAIQNYATVNVNGGEIHGGNTYYGGTNYCCIYNEGVFTMNNGTVTIDGKSGFESGTDNAKLYIKGGTITDGGSATTTIKLSGGLLEVTGGTIENKCASGTAIVSVSSGETQITIGEGATLTSNKENVVGIQNLANATANITMTGGTITTSNKCIANSVDDITSTGKWVITGGTLTSSAATAIYHPAPDTVIIGIDCDNGPTITGATAAVEHGAGALVVKGGTLTASAGSALTMAQQDNSVATSVNISCGTLTGESALSITNPNYFTTDNMEASISGGTFNGTVSETDDRIDGFITGGTFDGGTVLSALNSMCAPGYTAFANGTTPETWTVLPAYVLIYNANGGTGTMDTVVVKEENRVRQVLPCEFTFGTMPFIKWNTKADGTGTDYQPVSDNIELVNPDTTVLYAQWDGVAKIGPIAYPSLQAAIDDANATMTGDVTIDLVKNTSEVVKLLQKDGISITVNGNDNTLTGQMFISNRQGNPYLAYTGTYTEANTVTIENLNIKYDANYFDGYGEAGEDGLIYFCKNCAFGGEQGNGDVFNYSHNVTIRNCDFDADGSNRGVYAISSRAGSVYNLNIENCTAKNALGLATLQSAPEFEVINCSTEDVTYGIRIVNNYGPMTVTGNNFTADEVGILVTGMTTGATINFAEDTVTAHKAFQLASSCTSGTLDITSGLYIGEIDDNSTTDFFNISGGTYSEDVTGEACAPGYAAFANGSSPETWTVTKAWFLYYDKNEAAASGTMDTLFVRRDGDDAARTVTVASCEFTWLPYRTFNVWNTKADGLGDTLRPGDNITLTSDTTLFAIWKLGYTIMYHNNGGTGFIANQSKDAHVDITLSDGTGFSKEGHTLYRWNTQADGNGTNYALGATYSDNDNLDLYAVWRLNLDMTSTATDVVCYGQNNGTDTVKIIGGEAPYQIVLSGGALSDNAEITTDETTYVFTNLVPSTNEYKVWVTDVLAKDTIRASFTISEPAELLITSLTVPERPCPLMGTGTYEVSMTTTGGNGGNVITWGGDATNVNATETTITPDADDRDRTYTVTVTVTDSKNCSATETTTFSVAPVIANDETAHSNTTMAIATIEKGILSNCDTIIRDFGWPTFNFTNPLIDEHILDTVYNNVSTVAHDSVFAVGTHEILWTAIDTCGHIVTAKQVVNIYMLPCPNAVDYDGNSYPAVRIGCDCWMAENLRSNNYSDGRAIPNVMHYLAPTRAIDYNGNLYDWYAVMDATEGGTNSVAQIEAAYAAQESVQGICPTGWHIPTEAEVETMLSIFDSEQLMSDNLWIPDNGNNESGFNMLPSGYFNSSLDRYERMYVSAYFWVLTPPTAIYHACEFGSACSTIEMIPGSLKMGYSVRCVLDKE